VRLFGFEVSRVKAQSLSAVHSTGGWFGILRESFGGAWQRNIPVDAPRDLLAFSGVFAPVTLIAADFSKLRVKLVEDDADDISTEIKSGSPFLPVLRKPNHFQTRIQFWEQWILSKLLYGNAYALKERDRRGIVVSLYILDAQRVTPLVAENGDVYYKLAADHLSGLAEAVTVPAQEIIHDRMNCLWHPLVGVSPIYASALSATQGRRIQSNSTHFFQNASRPSGILVAPTSISDQDAAQMKARWEENYSGGNSGRTAVLGNGLKYEAMGIPAETSQLIEQLRWTVEDCARNLHVPLFKLGGPVPIGNTVEALQQTYYNDCLHALFEAAELCLDEGLELKKNNPSYYTEFDIENLLRMDTAAQVKSLAEEVGAGIAAPDEARAKRNRKPVPGGKYPYLQQQNYNLEALAKRDALPDPFAGAAKPAPEPAANDDEGEQVAAMADLFVKGMLKLTSQPKVLMLPNYSIVGSGGGGGGGGLSSHNVQFPEG
jgi:HK97 family phage portal protein